MNLSNIDELPKNQKFILPTINILDPISNSNLNLGEFISRDNSINISFIDTILDKKIVGFLKEDNNPQIIEQFNDRINLVENANYKDKRFKNTKEELSKNNFKIKNGKKRKIINKEIKKRDIEESGHSIFTESIMR